MHRHTQACFYGSANYSVIVNHIAIERIYECTLDAHENRNKN